MNGEDSAIGTVGRASVFGPDQHAGSTGRRLNPGDVERPANAEGQDDRHTRALRRDPILRATLASLETQSSRHGLAPKHSLTPAQTPAPSQTPLLRSESDTNRPLKRQNVSLDRPPTISLSASRLSCPEMVNFIFYDRCNKPRSRSFENCDTVGKLFAQAKAHGLAGVTQDGGLISARLSAGFVYNVVQGDREDFELSVSAIEKLVMKHVDRGDEPVCIVEIRAWEDLS